jgi:hypothetical protein
LRLLVPVGVADGYQFVARESLQHAPNRLTQLGRDQLTALYGDRDGNRQDAGGADASPEHG